MIIVFVCRNIWIMRIQTLLLALWVGKDGVGSAKVNPCSLEFMVCIAGLEDCHTMWRLLEMLQQTSLCCKRSALSARASPIGTEIHPWNASNNWREK